MWLIYAIAAAIFWGISYALSEKIFAEQIAPVTFLMLQMFVGTVIFLGVGWHGQLKRDLLILSTQAKLLSFVLIAIIVSTLGNLLISLSIQAKNATLAGLIEISYPLFTMIFSLLLFRVNHFSLSTLLGGALIISGVTVISLYG